MDKFPTPVVEWQRDGHALYVYAARADAAAMAAHHRGYGARVDTLDVWTIKVYPPNSPEAAELDAAKIEEIEDARRVFQALCTERGRLVDTMRIAHRKASVQLRDDDPLTAALARTDRLMRVWHDKLQDYRGTDMGCPCVVLPSGRLYPCPGHKGSPIETEHNARVLAVAK